ncbi:MAG: G2/mitotic-specific cyclin-B2, variant 2 [Marteilia pararefringens]
MELPINHNELTNVMKRRKSSLKNKGAYVPSISLKKAALQNNLENSFSTEFGDDKNENKGGFNPRTFLDLPSQNTASLAIHNQDVTTIDEMSDSCYLPKGVENIDEKDIHLPNHLSAYVMDIYRYSKWKELQASCMLSENFLSQSKVTPGNRTKLLDWIVNVHRSFKLIPETLHLSCRILDLALAKGTVSNRQLQLYGIASMWIACKMEEIYPPPMSDFLIVTDNAFDEHEMCECERIILQTLKFDVNPPTSLHFLKRAAKVTKSEVLTYVMAKYILELALLDYHLAHFLPSHSAATALYTAYVILNYGKTGGNI